VKGIKYANFAARKKKKHLVRTWGVIVFNKQNLQQKKKKKKKKKKKDVPW
jgi:hypothetical protein